MAEIDFLRTTILSRGLRFADERQLQDQLEERLRLALGDDLQREFILSPRDRPDFFWTSAGVAIEVKINTGRSLVFRQLERYAAHDLVKQVVLVIPRLAQLPQLLSDKPISVIEIWPMMI